MGGYHNELIELTYYIETLGPSKMEEVNTSLLQLQLQYILEISTQNRRKTIYLLFISIVAKNLGVPPKVGGCQYVIITKYWKMFWELSSKVGQKQWHCKIFRGLSNFSLSFVNLSHVIFLKTIILEHFLVLVLIIMSFQTWKKTNLSLKWFSRKKKDFA